MIYKSFNLTVFVRLLFFAIATAVLGIGLYVKNMAVAVPLAVLVLILGIELIYFLNTINRKVAYFFDAIRNDDTTLHFDEKIRNRSLYALHKSLNHLNAHIADIKMKNEYNEKFFHEMLKYSATGLMALDEKGYIELINDSALEHIGLPHMSHIELLKQKNNELYGVMMNILPGQSKSIKLLHGNELRHLTLKVAVLQFGENKYRLYSIFDIKTEIEENELDSWQKLIRIMTHEIMNSIAAITSLSSTLTRIYVKKRRPLPVREFTEKNISDTIHGLNVIENTGKGLMHFVDDYRQLTRIPVPVFKPIELREWIYAIHLLMKSKLDEENIRLNIQFKASARTLIGDVKLLNQVMINVINNAMDALKGIPDKKIEIVLKETPAGKLKISISDNGAGIQPEEIDKVFVPFYTTKENGSGIGLSLSRKIMRMHKGSISVFSRPGEQTTLVLDF
jgi:nitrogen fixation/metabolism regulation signal transduction histidine kinase